MAADKKLPKMLVPEFWKYRGRYSRTHIKRFRTEGPSPSRDRYPKVSPTSPLPQSQPLPSVNFMPGGSSSPRPKKATGRNAVKKSGRKR